MWKDDLQKDVLALAKKYDLTMLVFAGTVKKSKECLVCAGGNYDQMVYGISGIVEQISNTDDMILMDDVIQDIKNVTADKVTKRFY